MSLWHCPEHGMTGPMACCGKSGLVHISPELMQAAEEAVKRKAPPGDEWIARVAAECAKLTD